jgi:hypothetical protein
LRDRGNFESYYPAHASYPMRIHGAADFPQRVHQATPDEGITGLDIWDNTELSAVEAWRQWLDTQVSAWAAVACIECELGRQCINNPACDGVCSDCGWIDCECDR